MNFEKVSVIIPVLNEEKYIKKCLDSLILQDYPKESTEIILIDGMSEDNTIKIINEYICKYNFIKLVSNPKKTVQFALNEGIRSAEGYYVVRMDAHASYAADYISKSVEYLKKTGADNVGGPTVACGIAAVQKMIAATYRSPFALGGSSHYEENFEGYADTVAWGAFKKDTLINLGMYDERLPRSEDDDLNFRITENGGKIFITPQIKSVYYPQGSFKGLFKQYFNYGLWKVAVIKKHQRPSRISQLVPMLFVAFLMIFGILSFVSRFFLCVFSSIMAFYLILDIYFSFKNKYAENFKSKLGVAWSHIVIHIAYGLGFWTGIFKFLNANFDYFEKRGE